MYCPSPMGIAVNSVFVFLIAGGFPKLLTEFTGGFIGDAFNELISKGFAFHIHNPGFRESLGHGIDNGIQKMCFSESAGSVDK